MEESLNGKTEETEKENDEKLDVQEGEEGESVGEILIDGDSESVKESHGQEKETCKMQDVEESEEVIAEPPMDCDVIEAEMESKGIDVGLEDGMLNGAVESSMWPQSTQPKEEQSAYAAETVESNELVVDQTSMDSSVIEVESEGIDIDVGQEDGARESPMWLANGGITEIGIGGLSESTEDKHSPCSITEKEDVLAVSSLNENSGLAADLVKRGAENSSVIVDEECVENVNDDSLRPSGNASIVGSNDAFPQTKPNPHVISITQRTSWRSCCGLLQVLTRSK